MPYRVKKGDDGIQDAVRRIADEQIGRALDEIADDALSFDERVHQVRKRCKKLRGLLRLVRSSFDDYSDENKTFRDAARLLSGVRDVDTLIETFDELMEHYSEEIDRDGFASIRERLRRDVKEVRQDAETAVRMETFRRTMDKARERAAGWKLDDEGFDAVAGGLRKTYKRARKRMQAAWAEPSAEALHEWRKRVKYHWYHTRLLREINPEMMSPRETMADELSDLLGDHHDLAVLDERLMEAPEQFGPKTGLDAFRALLHRRKDQLEERAFELGRQILAERSKALARRLGGYWKVWSAGDNEHDELVVKA